MLNTLVFLAASTVSQFFVVNPQIQVPVIQTQTIAVTTTTIPIIRPYVYPYYYGPPAVLYTTPYYTYPNYPVYSVYPVYPNYRIYP
jgi:hypothetical protein